jgi:hypothetical protein
MVTLWALNEGLRRHHRFGALGHPALPWVARAGLAVVFVLALVDLAGETTELAG